MIYIRKSNPPSEMLREVSRIKSNPEWRKIQPGDTKAIRSKFDELNKAVIRQSLLEEQGGLCAYCMRRIENDGRMAHIEHWSPLSVDKEKALDYGNMLAVCDGGANSKEKEMRVLCCDAAKGDTTALTISPLNNAHMRKIAYDRDGYVKTKPVDEELEHDINEILRLNGLWKNGKFIVDTSTELVKGRKEAYAQFERFIKRLDKKDKCTSTEVKKKIDEICNSGKKPEYAGVLLYFLNKKYNSLLKREK